MPSTAFSNPNGFLAWELWRDAIPFNSKSRNSWSDVLSNPSGLLVAFNTPNSPNTSGETPVPEPLTPIAGALSLLPFGFGNVQRFRRRLVQELPAKPWRRRLVARSHFRMSGRRNQKTKKPLLTATKGVRLAVSYSSMPERVDLSCSLFDSPSPSRNNYGPEEPTSSSPQGMLGQCSIIKGVG